MITLVLDGCPIVVEAFVAAADPRAEVNGVYRLDWLLPNGDSERCWARAIGVQSYERIAPCGGRWPW